MEIINDRDARVTNFFTVLRERPAALIEQILLTPWAEAEFRRCLDIAEDGLEDARRFFLVCWASVKGGPAPGRSDFRWQKKNTRRSPAVQDIASLGHLLAAAQRLKNAQILSRDGLAVIRSMRGTGALIYFDPPYLPGTKGRKNGGYRYEPTPEWHEAAAEALRAHEGPVVAAGYRSALYAQEYEAFGWQRVERSQAANSGGRLLLFFDNLESLQDEQTLALRDATVAAWITAAQSLAGQGLIFLLTSRWKLPDWPEDERHWPLTHANYGDFLQMALAEKLAPAFYRDKRRLRRIYTTLHGNGRGLTLFAAAVQSLGAVQEELFLQKLAQAEADMQTDMALDVIVAHLSSAEKTLLARLPVYPTPVPPEGIQKLGLDLSAAPQTILQRLLAVSLVERTYAHRWQAYEYQLSPLVGAWLHAQDWPQPPQGLFQQAAVYQLYLFRQERKTLPQALAVYQAQRAAGADEAAYRFALDVIVGPLNRPGLYQTLLDEWLPDLRRAQNPYTLAEAIGQTGKQHHHLGNYETALGYLERSLQISQEIGDAAGLCATLFNMGFIYWQNGEQQQALEAWVTVYRLAAKIGLAQALQALENLAGQLGLDGGLAGWEALAKRMEQR